MKKKIISILCVGMLLLSLNGCKSMEKEEKSAQNGEKSESHLHTFHFCVKIGRAKITEKK